MIQQHPEIAAYLAADEAIDHEHPVVREAVAALAHDGDDAYTYARTAFAYVRDAIPHSADSGDPRVTWRASDVLATRNGICYAKSIALTALLRARAIPAGLCYQRLTADDGTNPVVHGLVALRLPGHDRWARVDPGATSRASTRSSPSGRAAGLGGTGGDRGGGLSDRPRHAPGAILRALRHARDRAELWRNLPAQL